MLAEKRPVVAEDLQSYAKLSDQTQEVGMVQVRLWDSGAGGYTGIYSANNLPYFVDANDTNTRIALASDLTSAINALGTVYQPLDSDLTSIAALTTTAYGRALLTLANQAALQSAVVAAQTGTGSTFVMQASPTLTTPNIGAATGASLTIAGTGSLTQGTTSSIYNETSQNQVYFNYSNGNGVAIRGTTSPRIYMLGVGGPAGASGTGLLAWANTTLDGSPSSTISQQASGIVQIGTTAANALGSLACANIVSVASSGDNIRVTGGGGSTWTYTAESDRLSILDRTGNIRVAWRLNSGGGWTFAGSSHSFRDATNSAYAQLLTGNLLLSNVGNYIQYKSGTGQRAGNATLVAGTVTVTNTTITANSVIRLSRKTASGTTGDLTYTLSAGASFTINSASASDTSVVSYDIVEVV